MRYLLTICFTVLSTLNSVAQNSQGFIPIEHGKLYYEKSGTGPPLIFLHGICLDHRMWKQQIDYFSKSYTCINVDLRGFGMSSVPDSTPYSFHEDIKTLMDSLHVANPITFIALSMGGKAAINFCLAYPEHTRSLILADVAIDGYNFKDFNLERITRLAREQGTAAANQLFLDEPVFASAKRDSLVFIRLRQMILSYSGWQWIHRNPVHGLSPPAIGQLSQIKVPVLIITGEKDIPDFQQIADLLHKNIKQSLKKEIPDAGHMSNMEQPMIFNRLVDEFLKSHN
jgi:pimeloyl-ACP methyl ester carboxylesterase